ncbi:MAG: hypothetical protein AUH01_06360 [Acidobacteria bacterium 13_2_20CM_56_17]|nr:MAG: hypothetical protein AUH01_06360 [Acidobacteria bacterium 13_2_20CM_56_17]
MRPIGGHQAAAPWPGFRTSARDSFGELARIAEQKPGQLHPDCCVSKGFHWDEAVLFAPHSLWKSGPTPVFWNGPVYRIAPALERAVNKQP